MSFSIDSKVGELLDDPRARAVVDKLLPDFSGNPQIGMARGMSLKMVAGFSGGKITSDMLSTVDQALKAL